MSNHFSADDLKSPGDDRRLDLTDVYLFKSSKDPSKLVLIMDSNPTVLRPGTQPGPGPGVLPRRGLPDQRRHRRRRARRRRVHLHLLRLQERQPDRDRLVRHRRPGPPARTGRRTAHHIPPGQLRRHRPAPPGRPGPAVRRAAQRPVLRRPRGHRAQLPVDRARPLRRQQRVHHRTRGPRRSVRHRPVDRRLGLHQPAPRRRHPGADGPRRGPHHQPVHQPRRRERPLQLPPARRRRGQLPRALVRGAGKRRLPPEEAQKAALQFLPDILRYDLTKPIAYPNGRKPIDDVYSYRFAWLSYGKIPPQGLKPHADLLTDFPYLGPPNPSHS